MLHPSIAQSQGGGSGGGMVVDVVAFLLFLDAHLVGGSFFTPAGAAPSVITPVVSVGMVTGWVTLGVANLRLGERFDMESAAILVRDDKYWPMHEDTFGDSGAFLALDNCAGWHRSSS